MKYIQAHNIASSIKEKFSRQYLYGILLVASNGISGLLAMIYIAFLVRILTFEDFAVVNLINGLSSLVILIFASLGTTMIYKAGYLSGKFGDASAVKFWRIMRRKTLFISAALSIVWIATTPFLTEYFNLSTIIPLLLFTPIMVVTLVASADKSLLFSKLSFGKIALLTVVEPTVKFLIAVVLVLIGLSTWAYTAIPISAIVIFIIGWIFVRTNNKSIKNVTNDKNDYTFPLKFFTAALASNLSGIIFLNLDVILANHYLSPTDAGVYSLSALIGKIIFFLGLLVTPFIIPLVSRNEGRNTDSKKILYVTIVGSLLFTIPAFIGIARFGEVFLPIIFGAKAIAALPYVPMISFAMLSFSVATIFTDYYLVKKYYTFPAVALLLGAVQLVSLELFHGSIGSFTLVMCSIWIAYCVIILTLHLFSVKIRKFEQIVSELPKIIYHSKFQKKP